MNIEDIKKDGRLEGYLRDQLNFMAKDCIKNPLLAPTLIDMTVKYIKEFIFLIYTSKTPVSEEIKDTLPQVDIPNEDVNKTDEELTYKINEVDAEDREYLQGWLQEKLGFYGLTPNQREKFALKIMNIFKPYLRTYTGTTQVATQVKQNIERNALIDFMDWFNNNGDRVSDGSVIKSPDVKEYLKEKGIK